MSGSSENLIYSPQGPSSFVSAFIISEVVALHKIGQTII